MNKRLTIRDTERGSQQPVSRSLARDGWRIFWSARDGYEIAFSEYQVRRVESLARGDKNEWHALVVGELHEDEEGAHAVVRDFVPNDWAECGPAHVHASAMDEARVRALAARLHPSLVPLGIIHTHPGYGTAASSTDREEFWRDPRAVSVIVDPTDRPTIAVYRGANGERLVERAEPLEERKRPAATVEKERPKSVDAASTTTQQCGGAAAKARGMLLCLVLNAAALLVAVAIRSDVARTEMAVHQVRVGIAALESRIIAQPTRTLSRCLPAIPASIPDGPNAICSDDLTR